MQGGGCLQCRCHAAVRDEAECCVPAWLFLGRLVTQPTPRHCSMAFKSIVTAIHPVMHPKQCGFHLPGGGDSGAWAECLGVGNTLELAHTPVSKLYWCCGWGLVAGLCAVLCAAAWLDLLFLRIFLEVTGSRTSQAAGTKLVGWWWFVGAGGQVNRGGVGHALGTACTQSVGRWGVVQCSSGWVGGGSPRAPLVLHGLFCCCHLDRQAAAPELARQQQQQGGWEVPFHWCWRAG